MIEEYRKDKEETEKPACYSDMKGREETAAKIRRRKNLEKHDRAALDQALPSL